MPNQGELVTIKSFEEISEIGDELYFSSNMIKFCGGTFEIKGYDRNGNLILEGFHQGYRLDGTWRWHESWIVDTDIDNRKVE